MSAVSGLPELTPVVAGADHQRGKRPAKRPWALRWAKHGGLYVILAVGSVVMIYPFLWMLATSLRSLSDVAVAGASIIPEHWLWSDYAQALSTFPFWKYLGNSLLTTIIPIVATVFTSSLAGFAFARMRVRGTSVLFVIVLATMPLPGEVTLVPQYVLFRELGMINTLYPLIIPSLFASPFYIFLFRQFYRRLPESLVHAAVIDGCGWFRMWWMCSLRWHALSRWPHRFCFPWGTGTTSSARPSISTATGGKLSQWRSLAFSPSTRLTRPV